VLEVSEPVIRTFGAVLVALALLKFGLDLDFGVVFGVALVAPVVALYLALLTAMYFAVEGLAKEEEKRTTIFIVSALVLVISAYIHLACLMQFMMHLYKCFSGTNVFQP
jgi:hypothetical protein